MDKKKYYVSVQSRTISEEQGATPYELEIEATVEELQQLHELFDKLGDVELRNFFRAHYPAIPYHHDDVNDIQDERLVQIYRTLYQLGTAETKSHIESMDILS